MLESRAQRLGVDASMIFHDRFVSQAELTEFLAAADIYITPYLKPEQITSGTLAYAVGLGQGGDLDAVPATRASCSPTGAGSSCPGGTPQAIAREVVGLLGDDAKRLALRRARGGARSRACCWPAVARRYVESFERARAEHARAAAHGLPGADARQAAGRAARDQPRAPPPHDRSTPASCSTRSSASRATTTATASTTTRARCS